MMTLQSSHDVKQLTDELECFAMWQSVLNWKLNCTGVHFEFVNVMRELREFKREAAVLAKRYGGRS